MCVCMCVCVCVCMCVCRDGVSVGGQESYSWHGTGTCTMSCLSLIIGTYCVRSVRPPSTASALG